MNTIEESREIIIRGLQELQNVCNTIPEKVCHKKCPYEDICLKLRCVGMTTGVTIQPCEWNLHELRQSLNPTQEMEEQEVSREEMIEEIHETADRILNNTEADKTQKEIEEGLDRVNKMLADL